MGGAICLLAWGKSPWTMVYGQALWFYGGYFRGNSRARKRETIQFITAKLNQQRYMGESSGFTGSTSVKTAERESVRQPSTSALNSVNQTTWQRPCIDTRNVKKEEKKLWSHHWNLQVTEIHSASNNKPPTERCSIGTVCRGRTTVGPFSEELWRKLITKS